MPRKPHSFDAQDRQIMRLLVEDGRISCAEIARRVPGLTERAARYRLNQLIERGAIQVRAVIDHKMVGLPVKADVWVEVDPGHVAEVSEKLARLPQASYVGHSTGDRDVIIQLVAQDIDDLHTLLTEVVGKVPGVRKTTTYLILRVIKDIYDWIPDEPDEPEAPDQVFE